MEILSTKHIIKQYTKQGLKVCDVCRCLYINDVRVFHFHTPRLILAIINKFC